MIEIIIELVTGVFALVTAIGIFVLFIIFLGKLWATFWKPLTHDLFGDGLVVFVLLLLLTGLGWLCMVIGNVILSWLL